MSHRIRPRRTVCVSIFAVTVLLSACTGSGSPSTPAAASPTASHAPSASPSTAVAGCGAVEKIEPYTPENQDRTHHEPGAGPALSTYSSSPPVSGPHAPTTLPAGVYDAPPPLENVLHSMEHGAAVVWYAPSAPAAQVAALATFVSQNQDHTIMAPFDYPSEGAVGQLPSGVQMALASWHRLQMCDSLSTDAALEFLRGYRSPTLGGGVYLGEAPEPGFNI